MKNFYRIILKKAYVILKRYKFLWFFGLFAAMMGNGREVQMLFRTSDTIPNLPTELSAWGQFFMDNTPAEVVGGIWQLMVLNPSAAFPMLAILVVIIIFFVWLIMMSQAALVHTTARINKSKAVDFRTVFHAVQEKVWDVFALNIFTRLILYGTLAILLIPFVGLLIVNDGNPVGMFGLIVLSFLVVVPLAMILNFVLKYALVYAVVENEKIMPAFRKAWQMFWQNWLVSIEFAVMMFVLNLLVVFGLIVALFFLAVPFVALSVLLLTTSIAGFANVTVVVALLVMLLLIAGVGAGWAVFQYAAWTLLFFELQKGKAYSKLHRIAARS